MQPNMFENEGQGDSFGGENLPISRAPFGELAFRVLFNGLAGHDVA
jgi:hypothetical protein